VSRKYTGVITMNTSGGSCPNGWEAIDNESARGPDGWTYININESGLFFGGMNSLGHGNSQLYTSFHTSHNPKTICTKSFDSSSGRPHLSMFTLKSGNCPSTHTEIPTSALQGWNDWTYAQANESGFYIGLLSSWSHDEHTHDEHAGYQHYQWTPTRVEKVCIRVMGVDDDAETAQGVFPVVVGLMSSSACPSDWNVRTVSTTSGDDGWFYMMANPNATFLGGRNDWGHGGGAYHQVSFHTSHVSFVCYRYFNRIGRPFFHIRTPHTGSCPGGFTTFEANQVKGWNAHGYIQLAADTLYIGGLSSWGRQDLGHGFINNNFTSQVTNRVCLKVENVD
jgi:hypothetical protein